MEERRKLITEKMILKSCKKLYEIIAPEFKPDIIVDIKDGGCTVGTLISQLFDKPKYSIDVHRPFLNSQPVKYLENLYLDMPQELKIITGMFNRFLRDNISPQAYGNGGLTAGTDLAILLVDDSVDTGDTMNAALGYLREKGYVNIKTASITHLRKDVKPDYVLYLGNFSFPWSSDFDFNRLLKLNTSSEKFLSQGIHI